MSYRAYIGLKNIQITIYIWYLINNKHVVGRNPLRLYQTAGTESNRKAKCMKQSMWTQQGMKTWQKTLSLVVRWYYHLFRKRKKSQWLLTIAGLLCGCHFKYDKHGPCGNNRATTMATFPLKWLFNPSCSLHKHNDWCRYIENQTA